MREAIQDHDIGEVPGWTHGTVGKILSELRVFTLASHSKQMLKGLHYRDATTFNQWCFSLLGSIMSYVSQMSINYAHDPDQLAKKLDPEQIAKGAVNRMSVLGVIPMGIDTPAQLLTGHSLIGQDTSANTGSRNFLIPPSLALAQKQYGAVSTLGKALSPFNDSGIAQQEVRSGFQALPLSNTWGARNLVDMVASQYPKSYQQ